MQDREFLRKMISCAHLRFQNNASISQIAKELRINRNKVSEILNLAEALGFVKFTFDFPRIEELEFELLEKYQEYGLKDVRVALMAKPNLIVEKTQSHYITWRLGFTASLYLKERLNQKLLEKKKDGQIGIGTLTIALSGGMTINEMISHFPDYRLETNEEVLILPASGGPSPAGSQSSSVNVNLLQRKFSPSDCAEVQDLYQYQVEEPNGDEYPLTIKVDQEVAKKLQNLDLLVSGIGSLGPNSVLSKTLISWGLNTPKVKRMFNAPEDLEVSNFDDFKKALLSQGIVGDFLAHILKRGGEIPDIEFQKYIKGIDVESLKTLAQVGSVIGVAGGEEKVEVIDAALKAKFLSVLITDEWAADKLIKKVN